MSVDEAFVWVEIDIDGCGLVFGQGSCTATLGGTVARKCFNTLGTCRLSAPLGIYDHVKPFRTLRMCQPRQSVPKGMMFFPCLTGNPSEFSATVNIAGSDDALSAFGRSATVSVPIADMTYHDRFFDPYWYERVSGAAQADGIGYFPGARGTMFSRLKKRWPHYAGRPLRVCVGRILDGALITETVRHYIITKFTGPTDDGGVTIEAKDVIDLADDKKAIAPATSEGRIGSDISADTAAPVFNLTPDGIGDAKYPASGRACIGTEIMDFTRSGDQITITARGVARSVIAAQREGSTFQIVLSYRNARIDDVIKGLLIEAGVDPVFWPDAKNAAEVDRWMSGTPISTDITKPTGVKKLISTLVPLGTSIYWESADQEVILKANRPVDGDQIFSLTDRSQNLAADVEEEDEKRLTEVIFYTVQTNPASASDNAESYDRAVVAVDGLAREAISYGSGRIKTVFCQWLNGGADAIARIAAQRLLKRFATSPQYVTIMVAYEDGKDIRLTDVALITTKGLQDDTGLEEPQLFQVIRRSEPVPGQQIELMLQSYQFSGRFGYATPNDTPTYLLATPAQRDPGMFAADPVTLRMPNGDPPYEAI